MDDGGDVPAAPMFVYVTMTTCGYCAEFFPTWKAFVTESRARSPDDKGRYSTVRLEIGKHVESVRRAHPVVERTAETAPSFPTVFFYGRDGKVVAFEGRRTMSNLTSFFDKMMKTSGGPKRGRE